MMSGIALSSTAGTFSALLLNRGFANDFTLFPLAGTASLTLTGLLFRGQVVNKFFFYCGGNNHHLILTAPAWLNQFSNPDLPGETVILPPLITLQQLIQGP